MFLKRLRRFEPGLQSGTRESAAPFVPDYIYAKEANQIPYRNVRYIWFKNRNLAVLGIPRLQVHFNYLISVAPFDTLI